MANIHRGEVNIELGGKIYLLRPSFNALCEIEAEIDKSLINLLSQFSQRGILIKEQIAIISAGLKAAEQTLPENLQELVELKGQLYVLPIICKFLERGLCL